MTDILVLGATGFTGRLVTRYLYAHKDHGSKFTFAVGARSKSKLDNLVSELSLDVAVNVILVDVTKPEQVDAAVKKFKVVINTVGPFMRWGTPVVAACVRHGINYVDVTGETFWVRDIIIEYDYAATKTGAIIIPGSGFDSIPSDVSAYLANKTLKAVVGPDTTIENSTSAWDIRSGASGGTLHTAIAALEEVPRAKLIASKKDYVLSPVEGLPSPRPRLLYTLPLSSPRVRGSFFAMVGANRSIVQRTWGLHELDARRPVIKASTSANDQPDARAERKRLAYGRQFKYDEFIVMQNVPAAILFTIAFTIGLASLAFIPPLRWLFKKLATKPGEGPSDEQMQKGWMKVTNVTSSVPTATTPRKYVKSTMYGKGDGYLTTAVMVSESALALLFDTNKLPALARRGGILTPMSALGDVLIERLKDTGRFEFTSEIVPASETAEGH